MNKLMVFEGKEIEIIVVDGTPYFNPYHVGNCLHMTSSTVRGHLAEMSDKQAILLTNSNVGNKDIRKFHNTGEKFLTESGVYKLVVKSRKPEAEKFTDWVCDEVLPSIRATGTYSAVNYAKALRQLADKVEEAERLKLTEAKYHGHTNTDGLYKVGEIAKEYGIEAKALNRFLMEAKVQYLPNGSKTWRLYSAYSKDNLAVTRTVKLNNGQEVVMLLWTAKGKDFIADVIDKEMPGWCVI